MDDGDDGSDGEQQLSTVQVRVHKRESDKAKEIRRSSHAYMREQEDKEAWKTVEMYAPDAPETLAVRERLKCDVKDEIDFSVSRRDYLASLNAISKSRDDGVVPAHTSVELSREKLLGMTLEEQVQALMSAAHVLHFDRLLELIPQGMQHANDVLRIIPQVPQPSTLNPQPSTLNPQPSTLNPQPDHVLRIIPQVPRPVSPQH
jgi:hypothetical protein